MANNPSHTDNETLGYFLQRNRSEKNIDLAEIAEETKIPLETLMAMENGDYAALPADAFARGFFSIYARLLNLDVTNVLERYTKERSLAQKNKKEASQTPSRLGDTVSPMAERPMMTPLSVLGFASVIVLLLLTGICWYLSWNPASFLSERLRSFGKEPVVQQKKDSKAPSLAPHTYNDELLQHQEKSANDQVAPSIQNTLAPDVGNYSLLAEFQEPTKVTITIDEEFPEEQTFAAGESHLWQAKGNMVLALPSNAKTRLTLNGVVIPLPEPSDGFITVSIPNHLHN
jgi:cytoskeleton protein RodZ